MDWFMVLLVLITIFIALGLHASIPLALLITYLTVLIYIGIRYPHPARWKDGKKETVHLGFTIVFFVFIMIILYILVLRVGMPDLLTIIVAGTIILIAVFIILGLTYPKGIRTL